METVTEYLRRRHLDLDLHRPVVNEAERTATFFLYNLSGQLVGFQQHRPDAGKTPQKLGPREAQYFTYRKQPTHGVWGLESFHLSDGPVFVTEGVFDAARLTAVGQTAMATCCNDPQRDLGNWLQSLARPVVVVTDNDEAGKKLAKFGNYVEYCPEEGQDLGDCPQEFVDFLVRKYNR
jgi:DNA primase